MCGPLKLGVWAVNIHVWSLGILYYCDIFQSKGIAIQYYTER